MRPVARRPLFASALALLVSAGCAGAPAAPPGSPSVSPSAVASASPAPPTGGAGASGGDVWLPEWAGDDVPDEVTSRRPLPFCGVERAPAPQPGIFVDRAVRLCFWNAHVGRTEAEFVSVQTTMEGAPIATIYRLAADGTVETFTDFTQDPFGGGQWLVSTCTKVVEAEGDELLGVSDCDAGQPLD